jgi:hypothetical protein
MPHVLLILNGKITKIADLILGQIIIDVLEIGFSAKNTKEGVQIMPAIIIINGKIIKIAQLKEKFVRKGSVF